MMAKNMGRPWADLAEGAKARTKFLNVNRTSTICVKQIEGLAKVLDL
jgi:hypothetical protein